MGYPDYLLDLAAAIARDRGEAAEQNSEDQASTAGRSALQRLRRCVAILAGVALIAAGMFAGQASAAEPVTERASVSSAGAQGTGASTQPAISADGQHIAFMSAASNLVPGDTNGRRDVFVRDLTTGMTERINVTSAGAQSEGVFSVGNSINSVAINADGSVVAFLTNAPLVPGDTNATFDAFVRDRAAGITERVSVTSAGGQATSAAQGVSISADGSRVAFVSSSTQLVLNNTRVEVFVRDRAQGVTLQVSRPDPGAPADGGSANDPSISGDGRYVAFHSTLEDMVIPDTNGAVSDVFVKDLDTGATVRASVASDGTPGNQASQQAAVSDDGRFVAFSSSATNLVPGDTNGVGDTFVRDTVTGETTRVSVSSAGIQGNNVINHDGLPSISANGRYVTFSSAASNLVSGDTNATTDVYVHDRLTHETTRASVSSAGTQGNAFSEQPAISADGSHVAFTSRASNLVAGDTNSVEDIFVRQLATADGTSPEVSYTLTPAAADGDNGWYRSDVDLSWTVADGQSPVQVSGCVDQTISADQPKTDYSCTATSAGGTTGPVTVTIGRDTTPPDVDTTVAPAAPDGDSGWYVSPLTLTYDCTDATSGVASCPPDAIVDQGAAQVVQVTGSDQAGNTRSVSSGPYDVDLTDPEVTCQTEPTFLLGQSGQVSATVTDTMSGPASPLVTAAADTSSVGSALTPLTGADAAGRTATVSCGYEVHYGFSGFEAPVDTGAVNVAKAGTAIPLKWRLTDHSGDPVTDLTSVRITTASHTCDGGAPEDAIEEIAPGASGLQNLGDGNYQLNWKSPKTYAGTCRTLQLDLGEGLLHTAEFRFRT